MKAWTSGAAVYVNGAGVPLTRTCTPPSKKGALLVWAGAIDAGTAGPIADPRITTISPGATAPAVLLAAFTTEEMKGTGGRSPVFLPTQTPRPKEHPLYSPPLREPPDASAEKEVLSPPRLRACKF